MVVFWLEYPLMHIAPLIAEVSNIIEDDIVVVTEYDLPKSRIAMGFVHPDFGNSKVYISADLQTRQKIIADSLQKNSFHIFHGIDKYPMNYSALKILNAAPCIIGFHLEAPYLDVFFKGLLRKFKSYLMIKYWSPKVDFLLTHGLLGIKYYTNNGFDKRKVYEFAYFFDEKITNKSSFDCKYKKFEHLKTKFLFIGEISKRKNLILLTTALIQLKNIVPWHLTVIGEGKLKEQIVDKLKASGCLSNVTFAGIVNNKDITKYYGKAATCLVHPSNFDGWGFVVSEALSHGVPVIVSDQCGVSSVIEGHKELGYVFEAGNLGALKENILKITNDYSLGDDINKRLVRAKKAESLLSSRTGAKYLKEIFNYLSDRGNKPLAPWNNWNV